MALTVAVVLATTAAPGMQTLIHANRLTAASNDLIAGLSLARSEALKRRTNTIVCKSGGGTTCVTTGTWDSGWIVVADVDNTGTWTAGDVLIRKYDAIGAQTAFTASIDTVVYDRNGQAGVDRSYTLCNSSIHKTRTVTVKASGMHTISSGTC